MSDPARTRFFLIGLSRLLGVVVALVGLVLSQKLPGAAGMVAGVALLLIGLAVTALLPRALARRWRSPPP